MITAEKRSESLADTPIAITALSQSQLTSAGITSVANLTSAPRIWCSEQLLGRVLNGFGQPIPLQPGPTWVELVPNTIHATTTP